MMNHANNAHAMIFLLKYSAVVTRSVSKKGSSINGGINEVERKLKRAPLKEGPLAVIKMHQISCKWLMRAYTPPVGARPLFSCGSSTHGVSRLNYIVVTHCKLNNVQHNRRSLVVPTAQMWSRGCYCDPNFDSRARSSELKPWERLVHCLATPAGTWAATIQADLP
jgi:hypothetical protein